MHRHRASPVHGALGGFGRSAGERPNHRTGVARAASRERQPLDFARSVRGGNGRGGIVVTRTWWIHVLRQAKPPVGSVAGILALILGGAVIDVLKPWPMKW